MINPEREKKTQQDFAAGECVGEQTVNMWLINFDSPAPNAKKPRS